MIGALVVLCWALVVGIALGVPIATVAWFLERP